MMLKNILKLKGAVELTANELKTLNRDHAPICEDGFKAKRCTEFGTVPAYWNVYQIVMLEAAKEDFFKHQVAL
ncbi:MAG: hypothetical protein REI96_05745 [Flavobacterium nitrogenifigens]|nr:hypothetical protein [Flavobacterium nitrogenifigens]KAF2338935.1 hypothetical protein DM397_02545 [Flavobacterium nitrogenifigens]MDQ8011929.1 hypothetical protein [Flavobacterium nitrogenifigens]